MSNYLDSADSDDGVDNNNDQTMCTASEEEVLSIKENCAALKAAGNEYFGRSAYSEAIEKYSEALGILKVANLPKDPLILLNRCAAYLALKKYVPALNDANQGDMILCTWNF